MRQLLRGLKVKTRKEVAIALSLIRPGPASGGMKSEFIERHVNGKMALDGQQGILLEIGALVLGVLTEKRHRCVCFEPEPAGDACEVELGLRHPAILAGIDNVYRVVFAERHRDPQ